MGDGFEQTTRWTMAINCRVSLWMALLALIVSPAVAAAQSARATNNILFRVVMVKSQFGQGSMFSIDVQGRQYWITAKHVLTGAEHPPFGSVSKKTVLLNVLDPRVEQVRWLAERFSVIDPGTNIDIVALAAPEVFLESPIPNPPADSDGAPFGGECEFLGFPFGNAWEAKFTPDQSFRMPFIKHCTVSGMIGTPLRFWVWDGINNVGFSGGPVVFNTGPQQKIMAVISSYQTEPSAVIAADQSGAAKKKERSGHGGAQPKEIVEVNSGFVIAFDIGYVIDAIKRTPIGPEVKSK